MFDCCLFWFVLINYVTALLVNWALVLIAVRHGDTTHKTLRVIFVAFMACIPMPVMCVTAIHCRRCSILSAVVMKCAIIVVIIGFLLLRPPGQL